MGSSLLPSDYLSKGQMRALKNKFGTAVSKEFEREWTKSVPEARLPVSSEALVVGGDCRLLSPVWVIDGRLILLVEYPNGDVQPLYISTGRGGGSERGSLVPCSLILDADHGPWIGKHFWDSRLQKWVSHDKINFPGKLQWIQSDVRAAVSSYWGNWVQ